MTTACLKRWADGLLAMSLLYTIWNSTIHNNALLDVLFLSQGIVPSYPHQRGTYYYYYYYLFSDALSVSLKHFLWPHRFVFLILVRVISKEDMCLVF